MASKFKNDRLIKERLDKLDKLEADIAELKEELKKKDEDCATKMKKMERAIYT